MGSGFAGAVRTLWKLPRFFCFSFFVPHSKRLERAAFQAADETHFLKTSVLRS